MKKLNKNLIVKILIIATLLSNCSFVNAGQFIDYEGTKYLADNGKFAINCWRWIDDDDDGLCECYRFDIYGNLQRNYKALDGKTTNEYGQWIVDDIVQKIYKSTGRPAGDNKILDAVQEDEYETIRSTDSVTGSVSFIKVAKERRINAAGEKTDKQKNKNSTGKPNVKGPQYKFDKGTKSFIMQVKKLNTKKPDAIATEGQIIDDAIIEEPPHQLASGSQIILGKDMREFVSDSSKYTKEMKNVKIWGGEVWDDVFCLSGNGAYVKFVLDGRNYMKVEVAHQTHGESTSDTNCVVELYVDGESVATYDEFNDDVPEVIEEWFDEGEKNIMLKANITGAAPGRKIYFHLGRFRKIKEKKDDE